MMAMIGKGLAVLAGGVGAAALDAHFPNGVDLPVVGHVKYGEIATAGALVVGGGMSYGKGGLSSVALAGMGGLAVEGLGRVAEHMPSLFGSAAQPQQMTAGVGAAPSAMTYREVGDPYFKSQVYAT